MNRRIELGGKAWQWGIATVAAVLTGALVAVGVGFGGYYYGVGDGRDSAPAPTALAPKAYTAEDLRGAATTCRVAPEDVTDTTLSVAKSKYDGVVRTCVITWLSPSPEVVAAWEVQTWDDLDKTFSYQASNLTVEWKQLDGGRDLTITLS